VGEVKLKDRHICCPLNLIFNNWSGLVNDTRFSSGWLGLWVGALRKVVLYGLKIHGGVGYMEGYDMSLLFRRGQLTACSFDGADYH